jgi:uncharacterized protein (DUF1697 family)
MNVLCEAFESLGLSGVTTFLGSGNVVFESSATGIKTLEKKIERGLQKALGRDVSVFLRTQAELERMAAFQPFEEAVTCGADVNIILLTDNLDERSESELMALETETDGFRLHGREIYWWRRKKRGTTLFATVPLGRALREPFTIRSMNTIVRLIAKRPWRRPAGSLQ